MGSLTRVWGSGYVDYELCLASALIITPHWLPALCFSLGSNFFQAPAVFVLCGAPADWDWKIGFCSLAIGQIGIRWGQACRSGMVWGSWGILVESERRCIIMIKLYGDKDELLWWWLLFISLFGSLVCLSQDNKQWWIRIGQAIFSHLHVSLVTTNLVPVEGKITAKSHFRSCLKTVIKVIRTDHKSPSSQDL